MSRIAMLFASREGQTRKIIEKIQPLLTKAGHQVDLIQIKPEPREINLKQYDAFFLGCSIRYGKHHRWFCDFVEANADILNKRLCFFFSVNMTARKPNRCEPYMNPYLVKYLENSCLTPDKVAVFGGALKYSQYNFLETQLIRMIMKLNKGPTSTESDIEFTDWVKVINFAEDFKLALGKVEPETEVA
ncbi:menaquinone-dependent protoporphyrinogen IX dehydrogenase [Endozoicomonas sp. OPT23]|uniref:menaquinone-dependent protoporphyrinogen IX dehydrogenase n=1 Tax=Endozoicomonas sp. OPT23 TaxID=2072845 RepID=UPI00129AFBE7|nr:menaquinone-dependent protoporphyrinogen IX dehydrogenase [Endozoicomonas sp. OPT23]MRI34715.1 menaquinone-dependent protoporphyrinogen IX dehydrogenase [Endozoicomonas sp. OPT23]